MLQKVLQVIRSYALQKVYMQKVFKVIRSYSMYYFLAYCGMSIRAHRWSLSCIQMHYAEHSRMFYLIQSHFPRCTKYLFPRFCRINPGAAHRGSEVKEEVEYIPIEYSHCEGQVQYM